MLPVGRESAAVPTHALAARVRHFDALASDGRPIAGQLRLAIHLAPDACPDVPRASALKVGQCVVAVGQADDTGAVTAQRLVVSAPVDGSCSSGFGGFRRPGGAQGDSGAQGGAA